MPSAISEWLKGEVAQVVHAKALGIPKIISHDDAVLAFKRAAEEIDRLYELLDEMRATVAGVPELNNRDRFGGLGARVNNALGR